MTDYQQTFAIAWRAEHRGELVFASELYEQAAREAHLQGHIQAELLYLSNLAETQVRIGQGRKAIETATTVLARARKDERLSSIEREVFEMRGIGRLLEGILQIDPRGRWLEAQILLSEGVQVAKQLNVDYWKVYFATLMAYGYLRSGDLANSHLALQEAEWQMHPHIDDYNYVQARVWWIFALWKLKQSDYFDARMYAAKSTKLAQEGGVLDFVARSELVSAEIEFIDGQKATALETTDNVVTRAQKYGWQAIEQSGLQVKGKIALSLGFYEEAISSYQRAFDLSIAMEMSEEKVQNLLGLGRAYLQQSVYDRGIDFLKQARRLSQELDYADHFEMTSSLLAHYRL